MSTSSFIQRFRRRVVFVAEEPGYIAVVVLLLMFLAFTPKAGCSFQEQPAAPAQAVAGH